MHVAIIAITASGARIGATLTAGIPDSSLYVLDKHAGPGTLPFSGRLQPLIERLWPQCRGFVFIMATGIVVRSVAPLLTSKDRDPAVVVIDDTGRFAISLLSGHLGGANALAARCAELTGASAVITTATDANDLPSFDLLAQDKGWRIDELSRVKFLNALLLEGKEIAVVDHEGAVRDYCAGRGRLRFHGDLGSALASAASGVVCVSNRVVPDLPEAPPVLVLRPANLCLGIGCNRGTSAEEIAAVVRGELERLGLSFKSVRCVATAQAKGDEVGLLAFAESAGLPVLLFDNEQLNRINTPSPASDYALAAIGARGVAEPAALLASEGGTLLLPKVKSGNVTLAIAED